MKPTERFSNRAEDYRRYRPGYPEAVAELMRRDCGLKAGARVADIGAGTGIFSRVLLEAGFAVTAVEPNDAMRGAADEELGGFPLYQSVAAPAEETGLGNGAFDAITVAQALHWFHRERAGKEFERLLRPGGWLFIVWNRREEDATAFARDYEEMLKTLGERYHAIGHRDLEHRRRTMESYFPAGAPRVATFDNPHVMDWDGLRGRFVSMSYVPVEGEAGHTELISALRGIFDAHARDGVVTFEQKTEVYYGRLK